MRTGRHGNRSGRVVLWSALLSLIAVAALSCTNSEVRSQRTQQATASTARGNGPSTVNSVNPCNPCAAKAMNPCAAKNPCSTKTMNPCNPCAAKNPCSAGDSIAPKLVTRPAGTAPFDGKHAQLITEGERLWQDRTLSSNGLACQTCHLNNASFNPTFTQPYPHMVAMSKQRAGLDQVDLDEMVQVCMVVPMAAKPLPWDSKELAALMAYAHEAQRGFIKAAAANPCMLKPAATNPCNPCAAKTPNPCAAKNPCAVKR